LNNRIIELEQQLTGKDSEKPPLDYNTSQKIIDLERKVNEQQSLISDIQKIIEFSLDLETVPPTTNLIEKLEFQLDILDELKSENDILKQEASESF
jgi:hypothetical protein